MWPASPVFAHFTHQSEKNKARIRLGSVSFFAPLPALPTSTPPPPSSHSPSSSSRDACDRCAARERDVVVEKDDRVREVEKSYCSMPLSLCCDAAGSRFSSFPTFSSPLQPFQRGCSVRLMSDLVNPSLRVPPSNGGQGKKRRD